jgi:hypothetical protein
MMPEKRIEDIKSIFCRCEETIKGKDMMDGWVCTCDILFTDETEERFFFDHIGLMRWSPKLKEVV